MHGCEPAELRFGLSGAETHQIGLTRPSNAILIGLAYGAEMCLLWKMHSYTITSPPLFTSMDHVSFTQHSLISANRPETVLNDYGSRGSVEATDTHNES